MSMSVGQNYESNTQESIPQPYYTLKNQSLSEKITSVSCTTLALLGMGLLASRAQSPWILAPTTVLTINFMNKEILRFQTPQDTDLLKSGLLLAGPLLAGSLILMDTFNRSWICSGLIALGVLAKAMDILQMDYVPISSRVRGS